MKTQIISIFLLSAALAATLPNQSHSQETVIKITDPKLSSINMGLESTEYWVEKMKTGDGNRAATLTRDLEKLATRFNRIPKSEDDQYKYVVNRFATLASAIAEKSKSKQLVDGVTRPAVNSGSETVAGRPHRNIFPINKQLDKIETSLRSVDPSNGPSTKTILKQLEYAEQLFAVVPVSRHPDFVSTKARMDTIKKRLHGMVPELGGNENPTEFLKKMRAKYITRNMPRAQKVMGSRELTSEDATYFIGGIKAMRADVDADLPRVKAAANATGTASDLVSWIEKESIEYIAAETEKLKKRLDNAIETELQHAENLAGLDVEKNKYTFVTESVRKNNEDRFARALRTMEQAKSFEEAFGWDGRWSSKKAELEKHVAAYRALASQAATVKKLPVDIGDKALAKIAKATLAIEKYGVGEVERMIVNAKMVPRDRIETRYFNGALETIVRKWDEFQVCTVEKEGGELVVYFNTLKKFSRAPRTTPIDQWILSTRYKSGSISPDSLK